MSSSFNTTKQPLGSMSVYNRASGRWYKVVRVDSNHNVVEAMAIKNTFNVVILCSSL